jgi:hypothetical protein
MTHDFEGEWHDAGTIESLLGANDFAAGFAGELPMRTAFEPGEVAAEAVDPATVRP